MSRYHHFLHYYCHRHHHQQQHHRYQVLCIKNNSFIYSVLFRKTQSHKTLMMLVLHYIDFSSLIPLPILHHPPYQHLLPEIPSDANQMMQVSLGSNEIIIHHYQLPAELYLYLYDPTWQLVSTNSYQRSETQLVQHTEMTCNIKQNHFYLIIVLNMIRHYNYKHESYCHPLDYH